MKARRPADTQWCVYSGNHSDLLNLLRKADGTATGGRGGKAAGHPLVLPHPRKQLHKYRFPLNHRLQFADGA